MFKINGIRQRVKVTYMKTMKGGDYIESTK